MTGGVPHEGGSRDEIIFLQNMEGQVESHQNLGQRDRFSFTALGRNKPTGSLISNF